MSNISGRKEEIGLLHQALVSNEAALIAIYGRRRVGKTFLIHEYYKDHIAFELTGMYGASLKEQLQQFSRSLEKATGSALPLKSPENWIVAFQALEQYITTKNKKKKQVIFLDEFPWLDGRKSGFFSAFEHFWNSWGSRQSNLIIVICGSAASWMIRNIVNNKGGLHNRITQKIRLLPFTLAESETYLKTKGIDLGNYQLLQIYMAFGGIPQYLKSIQSGDSATVAIEKACFVKDGILKGEFNNLYGSLFDIAEHHIKVVRTLAATPKGLTRQEIIEKCDLSSGGTTTLLLEELEESGFILSSVPFQKTSNDLIYRLIDEFSLFYLKFMDRFRSSGKDNWIKLSTTNAYKVWAGMAFESVCLKHAQQIKRALGIEGIQTQESTWRSLDRNNQAGAQIDLIIDRTDKSINICEIKFYNTEFVITKSYASEIERKLQVFLEKTKTKKTLFFTVITTYGLSENPYSQKLVQKSLTMQNLFS